MSNSRYFFLIVPLLLCACSEPQDPQISEEDRIFDSQRKALEKAKGVEDMMKENLKAQESMLEDPSHQ